MKKFKLPDTSPTVNKNIRFPSTVIKEVEELICGKDCTFTAFVIEATKVAIENLKEEERKNELNKKTRKTIK